MREALTLNQSESDKLKPTNLKSVQGVCSIINMAMFTLPSTSMWAHAIDIMLPRRPRPRERN